MVARTAAFAAGITSGRARPRTGRVTIGGSPGTRSKNYAVGLRCDRLRQGPPAWQRLLEAPEFVVSVKDPSVGPLGTPRSSSCGPYFGSTVQPTNDVSLSLEQDFRNRMRVATASDPIAMARLVFGEDSLTGESHSANLAVEALSETRFVHSIALAVPAIVVTLEAIAKEVDALKAAAGLGETEPAQ
jgi:hypothetical protein